MRRRSIKVAKDPARMKGNDRDCEVISDDFKVSHEEGNSRHCDNGRESKCFSINSIDEDQVKSVGKQIGVVWAEDCSGSG